MLIPDQKSLPRTIRQVNLPKLVGESLHWFCPACQELHTTEIGSDGTVRCPDCGEAPDWEQHPPVLAYGSRFKRVRDVCADGSPWRTVYEATEQRYGDFIEQTYRGLPRRTKAAGWRYFSKVWKSADELADYLIAARDAPGAGEIAAYTERELSRKYYDSRREINICSLSDLSFPRLEDDGGVHLTTQEDVEAMSLRAGYTRPFYMEDSVGELLELVHDPLERSIARDFAYGMTKRDVERKYALSERRVRTIVSHIAEVLK